MDTEETKKELIAIKRTAKEIAIYKDILGEEGVWANLHPSLEAHIPVNEVQRMNYILYLEFLKDVFPKKKDILRKIQERIE